MWPLVIQPVLTLIPTFTLLACSLTCTLLAYGLSFALLAYGLTISHPLPPKSTVIPSRGFTGLQMKFRQHDQRDMFAQQNPSCTVLDLFPFFDRCTIWQ